MGEHGGEADNITEVPSSVPPRTNGASVPKDFCYIKPLCSPFLCVTFFQSSNLKKYHSKLLKTHKYLVQVVETYGPYLLCRNKIALNSISLYDLSPFFKLPL